MPLRDHFHPPVSVRGAWDRVHGMWPAMMVQTLNPVLPPRYSAGPLVHLGSGVEVDVGTFHGDSAESREAAAGSGWLAPQPSVAVETDLLDADEYEMRVYDDERDQRLVAAVDIVSPSNKDRPETRQDFVAKCERLLRQGVCVVIVDIVTARNFNLYDELLERNDRNDPTLGSEPPAIYAASCRWIGRGRKLETWSKILSVGAALPTMPLWLAEDLAVPLDLESSYEQACRLLRFA